MNQALPTGFLQRISPYPAVVQKAIQAELSAPIIREAISLLHGQNEVEEAKVEGLLAKPQLVDGFLTRLIRSKRFMQRLGQLPAQLQKGGAPEHRRLILGFIAPLADPERPYLYKLREVLRDPKGLSAEQHQRISMLVAMLEFHTRLRGLPADPVRLVEAEMLHAASGAEKSLLPCLMGALGGPTSFHSKAGLPSGLSLLAGTAFAQAELADLGVAELPQSERRSLAFIARDMAGVGGEVRLYRPRPLRVVLNGSMAEKAREAWDEMAERGLVTLGVEDAPAKVATLQWPGHLPASPLLLSYLRCCAEGAAVIELKLQRNAGSNSWAERIEGYADTEMSDTVAWFRRGASEEKHFRAHLELAGREAEGLARQAVGSAHVVPEEAFAILLRSDASINLEPYLNVDRCVIVDGLDELTQRFAGAGPAVLQKPVICIGARTPVIDDYVVEAAQSYWRYGGRYPVTPVALDYDGEAAGFSLDVAEGLSHMAPMDLVTLPLELALRLGAPQAPQQVAGLMLWRQGLVVQCEMRLAMQSATFDGLLRWLNTMPLSDEEREAIFLTGHVDHAFFSDRPTIADWPVASLIGDIVRRHRNLETRLARFLKQPSAEMADMLVQALQNSTPSVQLTGQIDKFVLTAAARPELLLDMEGENLRAFLMLARQTPSCDAVAAYLAVYAGEIAKKHHHLIIPLFELLAGSLKVPAVNAAMAFVAADTRLSGRARHRLGECMRRYADADLMTQWLVQLSRDGSDLLEDSGFLRYFQKLLEAEALPALRALIGPRVVQAIAATVDFKASFRSALLEGERGRLIEMIGDPDQVGGVDFLPWMDSLRAFSNELRDLALPIADAALPQLSGIYGNKLMGAVFSDQEVLSELRDGGLLEDGTDLSLICKNLLGDNAPLNAMLAQRFAGSGVPSLRISGDNAAAVFAAAAGEAEVRQNLEGPKVSVVISAYNADIALLEQSLASVLDQTHGNLEVFVVDDASEPRNGAEVQAVAESDPRVTYMCMAVNSGPYMGRNRAIAAATGEFLAIQDADDWSHPYRFAEQLAVFAESAATQLVTTPHIRIDRAGRIQMEADFTILGDGPMTSMFRRSAFDEVGPFAPVRSRGDVEMRERMRAYFGGHALRELELPMMLCFADSATLSQKTKREKMEHLQLFRTNISRRRSLRDLRRDGQKLGAEHAVTVPLALRPTQAV